MSLRKFFSLILVVGVAFFLTSKELKAEEGSEQEVFDLGEIIITATKTPHLLKDVPISTTVINREEIEDSGAYNVGEALKGVAGAKVNIYGAMGSATSLSLRGSSSTQVLVLVDGRVVNLPSLGMADLSMYPIDNVERIEVVRGPASALYGANALGGVVNIVTRDIPKKPVGEVTISSGAFSTQLYQLSVGEKRGDFGYFLTSSKNKSDGDRENSQCDGYNFTGKLSYDLGEVSNLTFSTGYSQQDKGVPGSTSWLLPNANQDNKKRWFDLTYKSGLGEREGVTSKLFFNRDWQEYEDPDAWGGPQDDINKNYQWGGDLQQNLTLGETNLLTWGISWERDTVDIKKVGGKRKITTEAIYLQDEVTPSELLTLILGVRYDHHSVYGSEVNPRLSALYRWKEKTSLRVSVGRAFRAPTVNDLYWYEDWGWGTGCFGNSDLNPEKSWGYEAGIEHQFSPKLLGRVSLFRSKVDKLITWVETPPDSWHYVATNIDKARLQGVEAEARAQFTPQISGDLTYTYLDARDKGDTYHNKYLIYRPKSKLSLGLVYQSSSGLKVNVGGEYTDSVFSDRANTTKMNSFFLLSARISKTIEKNKELFLEGKNLLDKEYQLYKNYPMPGASISGGVKVGF
ncbi:MAG: hypothetical protein COS84_02750 [Armatimonadetes bacterium CG07_land_8_20_14_0_80_40_9]|nr:MAG: hypothetical protein COS84_02750 [Armatimonadetes bacterium CG07_land_8_20_14_0_80_40_9]